MQRVPVVLFVLLIIAGCASAPPRAPTGAETFANHCASCHGARGQGGGPLAAVLRTDVPNLQTLSRRNGGEFPADAVASYIDGRSLPASHGDRVMPVWGDVFDTTARLITDAQAAQLRIEAVIEHLRTLQVP